MTKSALAISLPAHPLSAFFLGRAITAVIFTAAKQVLTGTFPPGHYLADPRHDRSIHFRSSESLVSPPPDRGLPPVAARAT